MMQDGDGPGADSVGAPERGSAAPEGGTESEIRSLRDEVRRLREQVAALAARTKDEDVRIPTYVRGLDDALQGGVPRGHVIGIVGPGGSMKTSLALYTLIRNRAAGARGVFVTIEESRDSIVQTMRRLGLGDAEDFVVDISRLRLDYAGAEEIRDWVRVLEDYLSRRRERDPLGIVVIDSLDALAALTHIEDVRRELFHLFHFLRGLGATSFVIGEQDPVRPGVDHDVAFLADGVLELRFSGVGEGKVQLLVRIAKMRHTNHSRDYFVLDYGPEGFVARPYQVARPRRWGRRV
ncbi:MAG TPA: ATPase domain-containing protein [Thermoplasmata archaeon]|nr:ATPase domain-containing protein [Thermoplasmata archaeon]